MRIVVIGAGHLGGLGTFTLKSAPMLGAHENWGSHGFPNFFYASQRMAIF